MIPDIDTLYRRIANAIIAELPEEWTSATIVAIFYSESISWEPEFQPPNGPARSFHVSMELTRAFRDLRRKVKEAAHEPWGQATFQLQSNGKVNMKWGYDNCDENGDTIFDEAEWLRRGEERRRRLS